MKERKNKIIIGEPKENKNIGEVGKTKAEVISIIYRNLEEVCETIRSAAELAFKTEKKVSVYLIDNSVIVLQNLGKEENIFKTGHIVSFEFDKNYIYEEIDKLDEKTLKSLGIPEKEIQEFEKWYERHFSSEVSFTRFEDFNPRLGERIFDYVVNRVIDFECNPLDILETLFQSFTN